MKYQDDKLKSNLNRKSFVGTFLLINVKTIKLLDQVLSAIYLFQNNAHWSNDNKLIANSITFILPFNESYNFEEDVLKKLNKDIKLSFLALHGDIV
jgi:hypothetical protein